MYCIIKCIVQGNKRVLKTQICVTRPQCVKYRSTIVDRNISTVTVIVLIFQAGNLYCYLKKEEMELV